MKIFFTVQFHIKIVSEIKLPWSSCKWTADIQPCRESLGSRQFFWQIRFQFFGDFCFCFDVFQFSSFPTKADWLNSDKFVNIKYDNDNARVWNQEQNSLMFYFINCFCEKLKLCAEKQHAIWIAVQRSRGQLTSSEMLDFGPSCHCWWHERICWRSRRLWKLVWQEWKNGKQVTGLVCYHVGYLWNKARVVNNRGFNWHLIPSLV